MRLEQLMVALQRDYNVIMMMIKVMMAVYDGDEARCMREGDDDDA